MAKGIRVNVLARELGVTSREILVRCRSHGMGNLDHMSVLSAGTAASIRSWFAGSVPKHPASVPSASASRGVAGGAANPAQANSIPAVNPATRRPASVPQLRPIAPPLLDNPGSSASSQRPHLAGQQAGQLSSVGVPPPLKERFVLLPKPPREGGMASVYEAFDMVGSRKVAVKLFASSTVAVSFLAEAFKRECEALQELKHPNIIDLIDFGVDERTGRNFLVLEWLDANVTQLIEAQQRPPVLSNWDLFAEKIGMPVLEALAFAHNRSIAHRDVKPSNVLLTPDGHAKLADFGISKLKYWLQPGITLSEFYSPLYSPPGATDSAHDYSRDVFGFGMVVLTCLSRTPPTDHADITKSLDQLNAPVGVRKVIERAVSLDAAERPQTAGVLLAEMQASHGRQQALVARRPCYVHVTASAISGVQAELGVRAKEEAERLLLEDINDDPAVRPYRPLNPGPGPRQDVQFLILGGQFRYHVIVDREGPDRLAVLKAYRGSPSSHEKQKDEAFRPSLVFRKGRPASSAEGRQTLADLENAVEAFVSDLKVKEMEAREQRLLTAWEGILKAKSRLEQERRRPLGYSGVRIDGQRAVFELEADPDEDMVGEDRRVDLPVGRFAEGQVESVEGRRLTLYLMRGNPSDIPSEGSLVVDTLADRESIRRQQAALDAVAYDQAVRPDLRRLLVNPGVSLLASVEERISPFKKDLDDEKRRIVEKALRTVDMLAVEGPPGTGKTTLITEIVLQTLLRQPDARILLTSQTRVALDNAVQRIAEIKPDLRIVRVGRAGDGRTAEQIQDLLLDAQLNVWRQEVVQGGRQFIAEWAAGHGVPQGEVEMAMLIQELAAKLRAIDTKRQRMKEEHARLQDLTTAKKTGVMTPPDAVFDVDGEIAYSRDEIDELDEQIGSLDRDIGRLRGRLKVDRHYSELADVTAEELDGWVKMLLPDTAEATLFQKMLALHGLWIQRFGNDRAFHAAMIERSQVVAGTCIGMMAVRGTDDVEYDLCIIDEASKATPTEALVPMSRAKRWILVGDENQLPPFRDELFHDAKLREDFGVSRDEVSETLFGRLLKLLPDDCHESLTLQHRMVRPIGDLISECFYGGRLTSTDKPLDADLASVLPKPVTWFTTSRSQAKREQRSHSSFVNWTEAQLIRDVLQLLNFRAGHRGRQYHVAVISGYAAQRKVISDLITKDLKAWASLTIECNTVDAIQGREADIVIYSVTRSNESESIGFLRARERLNVALSRGKVGLVIVGDHQFVHTLQGDNPLRKVLQYIETHPKDCCVQEPAR